MNRAPPHDRGRAVVLGVGPGQDHQPFDPAPERAEPLAGPDHQALGVLVGRGGREDQHLVGPGGGQELGVERAALRAIRRRRPEPGSRGSESMAQL